MCAGIVLLYRAISPALLFVYSFHVSILVRLTNDFVTRICLSRDDAVSHDDIALLSTNLIKHMHTLFRDLILRFATRSPLFPLTLFHCILFMGSDAWLSFENFKLYTYVSKFAPAIHTSIVCFAGYLL